MFITTHQILQLEQYSTQKVNGNIDSPIYYVSRLLNQAEKNYSITEWEAFSNGIFGK